MRSCGGDYADTLALCVECPHVRERSSRATSCHERHMSVREWLGLLSHVEAEVLATVAGASHYGVPPRARIVGGRRQQAYQQQSGRKGHQGSDHASGDCPLRLCRTQGERFSLPPRLAVARASAPADNCVPFLPPADNRASSWPLGNPYLFLATGGRPVVAHWHPRSATPPLPMDSTAIFVVAHVRRHALRRPFGCRAPIPAPAQLGRRLQRLGLTSRRLMSKT